MARTTRRQFLQTTAAAGVGFWVAGGTRQALSRSANERPNVACIGVGGKGGSDSNNAAQFGNVIAICDVDRNTLESKGKADGFKDAEKFTDYRELLAKHGKNIQIATISTPDHMHAPATLAAMRLGISCYTQKPLTRTIYEARLLAKVAKETGVCTQMGNQGTALDSSREAIAQTPVRRARHVEGSLRLVESSDLGSRARPPHDHGEVRRAGQERESRRRRADHRRRRRRKSNAPSNGSTGRAGWASLRRGNSGPACTTASSGAAGGISAAAPWATWPATS